MAEKKFKFKVTLEGMEGSSVAGLTAPFDVLKTFGTRARVPVRGTINGFPFRSSLMPMGGCHRMVVNRTIREGAKVKAGDEVDVVMSRDTEKRTVDLPPELKKELAKSKKARERWDEMSYTHKKEIAAWILDAKKAETLKRRMAKAISVLKEEAKWAG